MSTEITFGVDELQPGERRRFVSGRRGVVVVRQKNGEYLAVADSCPHQGARLSQGHVGGVFTSDGGGDTHIERDGEIIRCPWHNFAFDLVTGDALLEPERYRVRSYPTEIRDGQVLIHL